MSSTDTYGIVCGLLGTAKTLLEENLTAFTSQGSTRRWGYFITNPTALRQIAQYAQAGQVFLLTMVSTLVILLILNRLMNSRIVN